MLPPSKARVIQSTRTVMASGQLFASEQYYATFLCLLHKKLTRAVLLYQDSAPAQVSCHCGNSPLALYLLITHHILHIGHHWALDVFPDLRKHRARAHFTTDFAVRAAAEAH